MFRSLETDNNAQDYSVKLFHVHKVEQQVAKAWATLGLHLAYDNR